MKNIEIAIFLSLNGKANDAISFYESLFEGELLFKITNKEFQQRMNPDIVIPKNEENFISHSVLMVGGIQLQIADNAVYHGMEFITGTEMSFSVLTENLDKANKIYKELNNYSSVEVLQEPTTNEFADFYAIVKDPFGVIIQITNEKETDPNKKGNK